MKTEKEINEIKEEVENMKQKLPELSEEELTDVSGGGMLGKQNLQEFVTLEPHNRHENAIDQLSDKISTGKKINRANDNPASQTITKRIEEQVQRLK